MSTRRHDAPPTDDCFLQDELRDLQSLVVNSDHVRWVTRAPDMPEFGAMLRTFTDGWRNLSDRVAHTLIGHGSVPDGRVSALADASQRAWLPGDWIDLDTASRWVARELSVLASWARTRADEVADPDVSRLFVEIEQQLREENDNFTEWQRHQQHLDLVDEAGRGSFPASDPPPFWAGH